MLWRVLLLKICPMTCSQVAVKAVAWRLITAGCAYCELWASAVQSRLLRGCFKEAVDCLKVERVCSCLIVAV